MPNRIVFQSIAWDEYTFWQSQDRKTLAKINLLHIRWVAVEVEGCRFGVQVFETFASPEVLLPFGVVEVVCFDSADKPLSIDRAEVFNEDFHGLHPECRIRANGHRH
jgi:hypothetical protein